MKNISVAIIQSHYAGDPQTTSRFYQNEVLKLIPNEKNKNNPKPTDLIILPELFHTPYFPFEENPEAFQFAIEKDSALVQEWQQIAKQVHAVIVFPFFEKRARGIYHNSVLVIERDGSIAGIYRKSHIPDDPSFYEKYYFIPGDTGFEPIQTSAGCLGILICWDQWFPEAARIMSLKGADILIYPTAIGYMASEPKEIYPRQLDSWKTVMRGHAIANRLFVAAANRIGQEGELSFWGNSFICAPDGYIVKETNENFNGILQADLNLNEIEENRHWWPHFRDRRTDLYGDILKIWGTK